MVGDVCRTSHKRVGRHPTKLSDHSRYLWPELIGFAPLAQSAEHSHGKAGVVGSIPTGGSVKVQVSR